MQHIPGDLGTISASDAVHRLQDAIGLGGDLSSEVLQRKGHAIPRWLQKTAGVSVQEFPSNVVTLIWMGSNVFSARWERGKLVVRLLRRG